MMEFLVALFFLGLFFYFRREEVSEVSGCMDKTATNYDPLATTDDGTCNIEEALYNDETCRDCISKNWKDDTTKMPRICIDDGCSNYEHLRVIFDEMRDNGDIVVSGPKSTTGCDHDACNLMRQSFDGDPGYCTRDECKGCSEDPNYDCSR